MQTLLFLSIIDASTLMLEIQHGNPQSRALGIYHDNVMGLGGPIWNAHHLTRSSLERHSILS